MMEQVNNSTTETISLPTIEEIKEKVKEKINHYGIKVKKENTQIILKTYKE